MEWPDFIELILKDLQLINLPGCVWQKFAIDDFNFTRCDNRLSCYSCDSGGEVEHDEFCFYVAATKQVTDPLYVEDLKKSSKNKKLKGLDDKLSNGPSFVFCADCVRRRYANSYISYVKDQLIHPPLVEIETKLLFN